MTNTSYEIRHVTHASPESDKREIIRVWNSRGGMYADLTRQRLTAPIGHERYGLAAAFSKDQCVGTTAYILSPRGQGILTQVYTDPEYRGHGIGKTTVAETVHILRELNGRAIYLAAWRDWVRAIYGKAGFAFIGAMGERHAMKLQLQPSGDDAVLFRKDQKTAIRPLAEDDQADMCACFNAKHPCVVKHYELGCFLGSHFEPEFFALRQHQDHIAIILDGEETIQGLATLMPSPRRHETHCATVDLLVHPNHETRAAELLGAIETTCSAKILNAYIAPSEHAKQCLFEKAGYRPVARLKNRLHIGSDVFDLDMYEKTT